jgi:RNA polymerase sigma factor (sigma-70 family)
VRDSLFLLAYPLALRSARVCSARMYSTLRKAGLDRSDLEQELLFGFYLALRQFDPSKASLRTFMERVMSAKMVSEHRRTSARKRVRGERPDTEAPRNFSVSVELRVDLRQGLKRLKSRDRSVARLLMEYRPVDVARKLGVSRAEVYRSIGRIRDVLVSLGFK